MRDSYLKVLPPVLYAVECAPGEYKILAIAYDDPHQEVGAQQNASPVDVTAWFAEYTELGSRLFSNPTKLLLTPEQLKIAGIQSGRTLVRVRGCRED